MQKRPNPFLHMMAWGFGSGWILAISFLVILFDVLGGGQESLIMLVSPSLWALTFMFGAVPGVLMGAIVGYALWRMLRNADLPFTKENMQEKHSSVYGIIFGLTLLLSFGLTTLVFGAVLSFFAIPPFIAAIASTYAAHRYMFRLRLWSEQSGTRKSKAKNDALLASRLSEQMDIETSIDHDMIDSETSVSGKQTS